MKDTATDIYTRGWDVGFKHGVLASGIHGAEKRLWVLLRALDQAKKQGYDEGKRAGLDERLKAASEAARKGLPLPQPIVGRYRSEEPNLRAQPRPRSDIKFSATPKPPYFHTRITMAATGSTIEKWDNRDSRGTVLIELHQADPNNPKRIGERVAVGQSQCDPTDKWNAVIGLKLAWERLIKDLCKNRPEFRDRPRYRWGMGARNVVDQFMKITTVGGDPIKLALELSTIAAKVASTSRYYKAPTTR